MSEWPLSTGLSTSLFIFQTSNVGGSSKVDVQKQREREINVKESQYFTKILYDLQIVEQQNVCYGWVKNIFFFNLFCQPCSNEYERWNVTACLVIVVVGI